MADFQPSPDTATLNQLQKQITDIYGEIRQLQPTSTTYPIPINAKNLNNKTIEKTLIKGIFLAIYGYLYPKQKAPPLEDIFDLTNELQGLRSELKTEQIALIFCNLDPHNELLSISQELTDDWLFIAFITNNQIEPPLRGFLADQENLLGIIQNWLGEL
jgi:hypothetical protein